MDSQAKASIELVLNGETSLTDPTFLTREQLIGEVRGLRRAKELVLEKRQELVNSEKPDNEIQHDTTEQ